MGTTYRLGFPIDETLHAEADAVDAELQGGFERGLLDLTWSGFHGDLGARGDAEVLMQRLKDGFHVPLRQQARGAPAEVDGINLVRKDHGWHGRARARLCGINRMDFRTELRHVAIHRLGRTDTGSEVAEAALGPAKRH